MNDKKPKSEWLAFRATTAEAKTIDRLAKMTGGNRSDVIRRLIPDLSRKKAK